MFDIALRRWKDKLVDPVARIVPTPISPGQITLIAFICGLLCCLTATTQFSTLTLLLWILNRGLDCLDGSLARHRSIASELGGFLDLLADFIVYSLLPIGIAWGQISSGRMKAIDWLAISTLEATFHINNFILFYSAAVAAQKDYRELTTVTMRPALIEGFESGLMFTLMVLLPEHISTLSWIMSIGVTFGICQRTIAVADFLAKRRSAIEKGSNGAR